jgi:hypothetical protein
MKSEHPVQKRSAQPRLLLSAISLAVLTLANQAAAQSDDANMTRVEVTGSSIKRLANEASLPVTTVKAEDLVKQGMTTLADFMMALPQSASLAPSNAGSGTNINLRGLGVNRTLVLLNGRRLANEAIADGYANLDVIPMSAIARVEVLRDGASSIYGSDAIGGVVNFITKTQFEGTQLTAQAVQPEKRRRRRTARQHHLGQGQSGTRRLELLRHHRRAPAYAFGLVGPRLSELRRKTDQLGRRQRWAPAATPPGQLHHADQQDRAEPIRCQRLPGAVLHRRPERHLRTRRQRIRHRAVRQPAGHLLRTRRQKAQRRS